MDKLAPKHPPICPVLVQIRAIIKFYLGLFYLLQSGVSLWGLFDTSLGHVASKQFKAGR